MPDQMFIKDTLISTLNHLAYLANNPSAPYKSIIRFLDTGEEYPIVRIEQLRFGDFQITYRTEHGRAVSLINPRASASVSLDLIDMDDQTGRHLQLTSVRNVRSKEMA